MPRYHPIVTPAPPSLPRPFPAIQHIKQPPNPLSKPLLTPPTPLNQTYNVRRFRLPLSGPIVASSHTHPSRSSKPLGFRSHVPSPLTRPHPRLTPNILSEILLGSPRNSRDALLGDTALVTENTVQSGIPVSRHLICVQRTDSLRFLVGFL